MTADEVRTAAGEALDAAGASMKLDRVSIAHGHSFNESDESYRRRLLAELVGAEAADAMLQPADVDAAPAPESHQAPALRDDGPTVEEFVKAGYPADKYPPAGYASKSTEAEVAAAIKAQKDAADASQTKDAPGAGEQAAAAPGTDKVLP